MPTGVASWSQTAASNSNADSAVNWAEGQAPSTVNDSARNEMASVAKWRDDISGSLTTGGTSTAYTITSNQSFASLTALNGHMLYIKLNATNGASPTLAVDGLTAKALTTDGSTAVPTGSMVSGSIWGVTYSSSSGAFIVHSAPVTAASFTTVSASSTISAAGQFLGYDGTKTAPSFSWTNDPDTGWYRIGANNAGLSCGDTKIIDATTAGIAVTGTFSASGNTTFTADVSAATVSGAQVATQPNQETGTATNLIVTPGRQHFHPSAAKSWLVIGVVGGSPPASYNVTTTTDNGAGKSIVTVATDFSSANYAITTGVAPNTAGVVINVDNVAAGSFELQTFNLAGAALDPATFHASCFGDQA